jgi:hypothetical protein
MTGPSGQQIVAYRKGLLYPFHNIRQFKPVRGLDIKREQLIREPEPLYLEDEAVCRLIKHPVKKREGPAQAEQRLPVIDRRADFVPDIRFKHA